MFLIVKFPDEEDRIAVVPHNWFEADSCHWPPGKDVEKLVKKQRVPEENWPEEYPAKIIKLFGKQACINCFILI